MDLRKQAEKLAARPYIEQVIKDITTDGQPVFVSFSPELVGCMSQGETDEEALVNLHQARVDFIFSLLEDSLPVPEPLNLPTTTASSNASIILHNDVSGLGRKWTVHQPHSQKDMLTHLVGVSTHT